MANRKIMLTEAINDMVVTQLLKEENYHEYLNMLSSFPQRVEWMVHEPVISGTLRWICRYKIQYHTDWGTKVVNRTCCAKCWKRTEEAYWYRLIDQQLLLDVLFVNSFLAGLTRYWYCHSHSRVIVVSDTKVWIVHFAIWDKPQRRKYLDSKLNMML